MKAWRITLLVGLLAMAVVPARSDETQEAPQDQNKLQGEWSMSSGSRDGQTLSDDVLKNSQRTCKGDEITITLGGELFMKAQFKLDPSKQPKHIDYRVSAGRNSGKSQLGIYEIDGDTVKFCFADPGRDRPTDFTTKSGDGRTSSAWKRTKK